MKINASIQLTLQHDKINIFLIDKASVDKIMEIQLNTEQFVKLITGKHIDDVEVFLPNQHNIGKKKITDVQHIECPELIYDEEYELWIKDHNYIRPGWELSHIGPIHHHNHKNGTVLVTVYIKRYEDIV